MTQHQEATAAAATVADESSELWRELLGKVAGCFPRESRQNAADTAGGLLMELEDYNCQPVAEAVGHASPHKLQHLLRGREVLSGRGRGRAAVQRHPGGITTP